MSNQLVLSNRFPNLTEIDFVIPAYNEVENIEALFLDIKKEFEAIGVANFRAIFVENGSSDGSSDLLKRLNAADPRCCSVVLSRNFGPQGAITAGLAHSNANWVCIMDGDRQDPPHDAARMYQKAKAESLDVVYAVRRSRKETLLRKIGFLTFYRVWRAMSEVRVPLDAGEFAVMRRPVIDMMVSLPEYHRFNRGLRTWVGFKQDGLEHDRPERVAGEQKFNIYKDLKLGSQAVMAFSLMPLRAIFFMGLGVSGIAFLILLVNLVAILLDWVGAPALREALPRGIESLNLIVLFFFGLIFVSLGIIGEYVGKVFEQAKGRPNFVVSQVIDGKTE